MTLRDLLDEASLRPWEFIVMADNHTGGLEPRPDDEELALALVNHAEDFIALYEAAKGLGLLLNEIAQRDDYRAVFDFAADHGMPYTGPQYGYNVNDELLPAVERLRPLMEGESDGTT